MGYTPAHLAAAWLAAIEMMEQDRELRQILADRANNKLPPSVHLLPGEYLEAMKESSNHAKMGDASRIN